MVLPKRRDLKIDDSIYEKEDKKNSGVKLPMKNKKKSKTDLTKETHLDFVEGVDDKKYKFEDQHKITNDTVIDKFIFDKAVKIDKMIKKDRIAQGKLFSEVYDKLSCDSWNGKYVEWLNIYGFNRKTAYNHRNRYKLYECMNSTKGKSNVAAMGQKLIDLILVHDDFETITTLIDGDLDKNKLTLLLEPPKKEVGEDFGEFKLNISNEYKEVKKHSRTFRDTVIRSLEEGIDIDKEELKKDIQSQINMFISLRDALIEKK